MVVASAVVVEVRKDYRLLPLPAISTAFQIQKQKKNRHFPSVSPAAEQNSLPSSYPCQAEETVPLGARRIVSSVVEVMMPVLLLWAP